MRNGPRRPLVFLRGRHMLQIAAAYEETEQGFIGICDGRIVVRDADASVVARALIQHAHYAFKGPATFHSCGSS